MALFKFILRYLQCKFKRIRLWNYRKFRNRREMQKECRFKILW